MRSTTALSLCLLFCSGAYVDAQQFSSLACPIQNPSEPKLRIGVVEGHVSLWGRSLDFASVTFYSSVNKKVWAGKTDENGVFRTSELRPDRYYIDIADWGITSVQLIPIPDDAKTGFGSTYWLDLLSPDCVAVGLGGN